MGSKISVGSSLLRAAYGTNRISGIDPMHRGRWAFLQGRAEQQPWIHEGRQVRRESKLELARYLWLLSFEQSAALAYWRRQEK